MTYIIEVAEFQDYIKIYKAIPADNESWDVYIMSNNDWDYSDNVGKQGLEYMLNNATTIYEERKNVV